MPPVNPNSRAFEEGMVNDLTPLLNQIFLMAFFCICLRLDDCVDARRRAQSAGLGARRGR
jgi:hypothetical protein